jgi:heme oxygenase
MVTVDGQIDDGVTFSETIKVASWAVHDHAERSQFMRRLLSGEAPIGEYAQLVSQHWFAYDALEDAAEALTGDPLVREFAIPELNRRPALRSDLAALFGPDWASQIVPNAGTLEYAARIREVCFDWPGGFIAHHYVRYLGDLSGGQIIRRILQRTYDIEDNAGISFYVFDQLDNGVQFKKRYRELLDTAPWSDDERQRIIDEVILAFELNTKVLELLG